MRLILIAVLAAAASFAAYGDVYKWVDQNGNVHYGDKPKQGGDRVDVKPGSGSGEPTGEQADKIAKDRQAACDQKKAKLATYKNAASVTETNSLGQVREYNEQEKQALIAKAEKDVADACNPPAPARQ